MKFVNLFQRLVREEDGPTAVEYAVMLALILGVIIASVSAFGLAANDMYGEINTEMEGALNN